MAIDSETILINIKKLFDEQLDIVEIGASAPSASKAIVFDEFPLEVHPEDDLTMLLSPTDLINDDEQVNAITMSEREFIPEPLGGTQITNYNSFQPHHGNNVTSLTDYETYRFRIWHWLGFRDNSYRRAIRYRDAMKELIKANPTLLFVEDESYCIQRVGRLQTMFTELFYSKSGAVHITANELSVTVIN